MAKVGSVGCGDAVIKHSVNYVMAKGFWETVPMIYAALNSPTRYMGRNLGFHMPVAHVTHSSLPSVVTRRIIADFSAIYRGSVTVTV